MPKIVVALFFYITLLMAKVPFFVSLTPIRGDNIYCAIFVCSYKLSYKFAAS